MIFTDSKGVEWLITEITDPALRNLPADRLQMPEFKSGWLLFQSDTAKKRLAPFPDDWRNMGPAELETLCERARVAPATFQSPSLDADVPRSIDV